WIYAFAVAVGACIVGAYSQTIAERWTDVTFNLVRTMLQPLLPSIVVDIPGRSITTGSFGILVNRACCGIEGAALMLVFSLTWLCFFRRDCRFPNALLLVPAGIVLVTMLNVLRIVALFLIGVAGAPDIAVGGFHSQAGWIAFTGTALGLSYGARRIAWFSKT